MAIAVRVPHHEQDTGTPDTRGSGPVVRPDGRGRSCRTCDSSGAERDGAEVRPTGPNRRPHEPGTLPDRGKCSPYRGPSSSEGSCHQDVMRRVAQ